MVMPKKPASLSSATLSQGYCSLRSISAARLAISPSARRRAFSWRDFCAGVRSKFIGALPSSRGGSDEIEIGFADGGDARWRHGHADMAGIGNDGDAHIGPRRLQERRETIGKEQLVCAADQHDGRLGAACQSREIVAWRGEIDRHAETIKAGQSLHLRRRR